ncbi:hypothetical protein BELL_0725g00050 [Botrytis elliptica]|uniref:Uncharacterized protein n=1 Tax=Botrytis elliptica TaxID=278938 RepID=A0A4Z1JB25_9HELO|nr:hypothetical protein BELL_0725g00050 [Botrytis elliptica]
MNWNVFSCKCGANIPFLIEEQRIEREAEEIEEKENAMTTAAEATVIRPDSVLSPSEGGVGGEDDQGMGGRSGVILGAGGGAIHQNLVSRPKPLTPEQQSARRLHLALRRRAADVRRKEARRAARRKECAGLIKKDSTHPAQPRSSPPPLASNKNTTTILLTTAADTKLELYWWQTERDIWDI